MARDIDIDELIERSNSAISKGSATLGIDTPYTLDPSGLGVILKELGVSLPNQQIGMDYLMGNWNDGPMTRPPYDNSAYEGIYKPYQYGEFSRQGNPLFKLGMFRGQGGSDPTRIGKGTWQDPNLISPLPDRQQKYSHLNIPGTSAFSWGKQATDVTGHTIVREVTKEAHRKKMEAEVSRLGPDEYRKRYGDIPSEWGQSGKQIEAGGLSDEMSNAWGSYSPGADVIRIRQASNPTDAGIHYQGPNRVMGTVVHEGMHRGVEILEKMKADNTSAWGRGMTDREIINAPPGPLQPYRDLPGPWNNSVLAAIPIEKHKLLGAMTAKERESAIGGGGVSYLEKRFTDKPWERTIGGERVTLPMLINMYKYKDKTNESPVEGYGGEHALMAMMMQRSPGGFDSDQMRMNAIKEMNQKIRPFITTKYNEALGRGERDPSSTADYPVNVGPQWLESLEGAGKAIEDYLIKRHRWTPGGGKSTVLDRHIYGQYEVPD